MGQEGDPEQNGKALTALILGIASLVFILIFPLFGLISGIIGIVFGVKGRRAEKKTQAIVGLILSIAGTCINGLLLLFAVIAVLLLLS